MITITKKTSRILLAAGTSLLLASCVTNSTVNDERDPFEGTNRAVFSFNSAVDNNIIHPTMKAYRAVVPKPARNGFRNFLFNLNSPVRFANQILQGDIEGAGNEFVRTVVNTLVGVGGIFDVAGYEGLKAEREDFGQTLAVWGVDHGPYMVVPFLGPSSLRDYVGYAVDAFANPARLYLHNTDRDGLAYAKLGADYLILRDDLMDVLEDLEMSSIDYYAAVRSTYFQNRDALVNDGVKKKTAAPVIPDFDDEDF